MSARATRGPGAGAVGAMVTDRLGSVADSCFWICVFGRLGASWRVNQSRSDSSDMLAPSVASDPTMMRMEVPAFRSLRSTARYGSSMSAFVAFPVAFASAISVASFWASVGGVVGIDWEKTGVRLGSGKGNTNAGQGGNLSVLA